MNDEHSRRKFIQALGALLLAGSADGLASLIQSAEAAAPKKAKKQYRVSQWTGDDFTRGHQFRSGDLPKNLSDTPDKTVDFVIIGGGVAGLTTAFYLRDQDFLLLEQYDQLGGQSRGGSHRGIDYSYGAAYIDTVEGIYGELYSELGIAPYKLPAGDNAFYWDKKWYQGLTPKDANRLYRHFKRLTADASSSIKILPTEDAPQSMTTTELAKLDSMPFSATLKGYPPQFLALLDSICRSSLCGNINQVSALSGLYLVEDLSSSNYVFKGGNTAITKGLLSKLRANGGESRLAPGAFVWKVELTDSGAKVMYTGKDGQPHTVACKHVIVTTPPLVAWRQVKNMPDKMRANLMQFKYGSYLVANCLLDKRIFTGAYDNWLGSPYTIADITLADTPYVRSGSHRPQMGSVLTIYQPWEPGSAGRSLLMIGDRQKFAKSIRDQLAPLISQLDNHLEEIVLSRWGHAMPVAGPGYYARLLKICDAQTGNLTLAHSSTQGMPSAEAAIRAGRFAAQRAKAASARVTMLVESALS